MKDGQYDYLTKSNVSSSINFTKSPIKYTQADSKIGDLSYSKSPTNVGRK